MVNELIRIGPVRLRDEPLVRGKVIIKRGKLTVSVSDVLKLKLLDENIGLNTAR